MTRMQTMRQGGNPGPKERRQTRQTAHAPPFLPRRATKRGGASVRPHTRGDSSRERKSLFSGVMSSLKDDGGWGLVFNPDFFPERTKSETKDKNGQARKTLAQRPKPRHPILVFQSVWALGPTGCGKESKTRRFRTRGRQPKLIPFCPRRGSFPLSRGQSNNSLG